METIALKHLLKKRYEALSIPVLQRHNQKLLRLWKDSRTRSPECLLNLSDAKLTILEENVLRLGLKHHILPKKIDEMSLRVEVEKLVSNIQYDVPVILNLEFKEKLKSLVKSYTSEANGICANKTNQAFHRTLRRLSANKEIKVCRYDKGNGVVVLNCKDYFDKLDTIVLDKEKFEEISFHESDVHPIITNENKIKDFLYRNIRGKIDDVVYNSIVPSGSQPGKLYGLCKVHKAGNPLRPVISMLGTAEYQLAKYLDDFIKPNINEENSVSSTNDFIKKLNDFQFSKGDHMVSFDVSSLFTNVPLQETIDLISDCVYSQDSKKVPPFEKKWFRKMLKFATSGLFLYKDGLFRQVDGVAMGSPLGPSFANFFLGHLERYKFFHNSDINPKLYVRYVDDIFAVFSENVSVDPFFNHINQQHPQIKFTVENSENNILAFLDTQIKLEDDHFESIVYRKQTYTGVLLNIEAVCPMNWKKGLILGAINRASIICSTKEAFLSEVEKLKLIFWKNGYSKSFFDKVFAYFEQKKATLAQTVDESERNFIIKIPYVGKISNDFKNKLKQLFLNDLNVEIMPVFNSFKVSSYFSLKSKSPSLLSSNVVYKFSGLCDSNVTYIGKTKRHLMVRCLEHLDIESSKKSEIKEHLKSCNLCRNSSSENFEILRKCKSDRESKICEAFFIKTEVPQLNKNLFNKGSFYTLRIYQ